MPQICIMIYKPIIAYIIVPSLFNRGQHGSDKKGLGTIIPHDLKQGDDEFDAYRKRMMMAYRFRPNPLVSFELLLF